MKFGYQSPHRIVGALAFGVNTTLVHYIIVQVASNFCV